MDMIRIPLFLLFALGISVSFAGTGARLLRQPDISTEAIVFVHGGDLWTMPRGGGGAHRLMRTEEVEEFPKFSPDGKLIAFTRGGSVFVMASAGGEERQLTWRPGWNQVLGWTADGKNVLIHSDRLKGSVTTNPHLFLVPERGGWAKPLPVPRATHGSFSEDGHKIAYGPNPEIVLWTPFRHYRGGALGYIAIYDLTNNAYAELPRTNANDVFPMWHGQAIYFASDRSGTMNLYRYDLESKQTQQLTSYAEWDVANPSMGKDAIIFENGGRLFTLDLESKAVRELAISLPRDALPGDQEKVRWGQALNDAWRAYREHAFHPAENWAAVKPRYEELMRWATDASDASSVIRDMLAEAGQSHLIFWVPGSGGHGPGVGLPGADFTVENGRYRIAKVYLGEESDGKPTGPLAAAGVVEGEYLLEVGGTPVEPLRDIYAAFDGLAEKEARLKVGPDPSGQASREVTVKLSSDERALRWTEFARGNRARVTEASGGRVGYIYIQNVDPEGLDSFRKQWMELRHEVDAMIVDVRNCNGGTMSEAVVDILAARPTRRMYDRRGMVPPFGVFLDGPKVMIANDQSVSGCDEVPMMFKRGKLGPLVGTRTFGGMIGAGDTYRITGGGSMVVPEFGFYSDGIGWSPENFGVEPDYMVELKPSALTGGRDPQLEKAIELSMEALRAYTKAPPPPPYEPPE